MKDFRGKELKFNDKVVVTVTQSTCVANLHEGIITGFCNRAGYDCATVEYIDIWYPGTVNETKRRYEITVSSSKIVKL